MPGIVGLNEFAEHSVGGSTFLAFDKVEGGELGWEGGDYQENIGAGGQSAGWRDMIVPVGTARTMLQTHNLLACLKPASLGALPTKIEKIQGGEVTTSNRAQLQEDCYLRRVRISGSRGGAVMVEYGWLALLSAAATVASAQAKQTAKPFVWHASDVNFDAAGLTCLTWEATASVGIKAQTSQDLKASGAQRLPEWIDPGNFSAELSATVRVPKSLDFSDDFIAAMSFKVTASNSTGSLFVLDMTGGNKVHLNPNPIPIVAGDEAVVYRIGGQIETNDLSAWVTSIA